MTILKRKEKDMSYLIAFRDTEEKEAVMDKLWDAKEALMEACKMMEDADNETSMNERSSHRAYRERRGRGHYRGGSPMPAEGRYDY